MKESPQRIIGAVDLLGLVFLVKMVAKTSESSSLVRVPGSNDNQSNAVALFVE